MSEPFEGWAVLELMGHRRIAGKLTEQTGGCFAGLLRIDIPGPGPGEAIVATQFYSSAAVYCITPTTEEIARAVAAKSQPEPVHEWELPKKLAAPPAPLGDVVDVGDPADFDDLDDAQRDEFADPPGGGD